jgi:hypothetical protein
MILLFGLALAALQAEPSGTFGGARKVLDAGGKIAEEPVRDVGALRTIIPDALVRAQDAPYAMPAATGCEGLHAEIDGLTAALGPDLTSETSANRDEAGHIAEASEKTIVNSFIPFRGLVREASGAAAAQRRLDQAQNAGFARRGFLRGVAASRRCATN